MKRTALNLLLLAVVAGLGLWVWLGAENPEKGPPLTALEESAITRIAVEHPQQPAIRLEKRDGSWFLTEPVQSAADPFEVNGILSLTSLEREQTLDAGVDRAALELAPPQYSVTLDDTRIDIGGTEPIKFRRYVAVGDTVGLVADPPSAALDADYSDLVAREIVPKGRTLQRIELPGLTLAREGETWKSTEQPDADPAQLAKLAQAWQDARALWNAAEPAEGSSGDNVRLVLEDGSAIELKVQAREPQLLLARPALKVHYTVSKALVKELFELPSKDTEEDGDAS